MAKKDAASHVYSRVGCYEDRELNQARSKPDPVNIPVRTARTFVHHYNGTQYCSTEPVFLIVPFLQTNITSQWNQCRVSGCWCTTADLPRYAGVPTMERRNDFSPIILAKPKSHNFTWNASKHEQLAITILAVIMKRRGIVFSGVHLTTCKLLNH